jgi:DNA-binding NarL/FixJ family response regulator
MSTSVLNGIPAAKRVLIADDSEIVRNIVRTFLTNAGFQVCGEVEDGCAAIERAKQLRPDLIVLDLSMPAMNGAEAASVLKGLMPDVPIVLFTMYSESVGSSLASAVGVDLVVCKPDGISNLVERIRSLLASIQSNALPSLRAEQTALEQAPGDKQKS